MELIEIRKCAESKWAALPLPNPPNVQCHHLNRWIVLSAVCVRESQVWFVSGWGSTSSTYLIFSNLCSVFHKPTAFQPFFRSFATFCNFPLYRMWNNTSDRKSMVACLLGERRTETKQNKTGTKPHLTRAHARAVCHGHGPCWSPRPCPFHEQPNARPSLQ